jgi:hypothetical protein
MHTTTAISFVYSGSKRFKCAIFEACFLTCNKIFEACFFNLQPKAQSKMAFQTLSFQSSKFNQI